MEHLHYDLTLRTGDSVQVTLDKQANVRLLDSTNYQHYRRGRKHKFYGGRATVSPFIVSAPSSGNWHLAIDLGGYAGRISASINVI